MHILTSTVQDYCTVEALLSDLFYVGTVIVQTTNVACICSNEVFDKSTRSKRKGCCLIIGWLVYSTINSYHWLLSDLNIFIARKDHEYTVVTSTLIDKLYTASNGSN